MPPVFFYFIGTVTGGFSSGTAGGAAAPLTVIAEQPGFLKDQLDLRLRDNDFAVTWVEQLEVSESAEMPRRMLVIDAGLSNKVLQGEQVAISFETEANALTRDFEIIRIQRSLYTALADIAAANATSDKPLDASALVTLNAQPRIWQLDTSPAGKRTVIPSGFQQAVPGILVMFTLLVLLTSGGTQLILERRQGLLRRLASAPISRSEVVAGKWCSRMVLAAVQVCVAMLVGTFLFKMDWGPDPGTLLLVLAAWCGFCASAGLWLGTVAKTEGQASGLGVLAANALAALGGCWWPIEITPGWMQTLQNFLPTGWTMDALHKLISFQAGAASVLPQLAFLLIASLAIGVVAVRKFEYQ